jgi:PD-(D/E)XK nuclease superfamily
MNNLLPNLMRLTQRKEDFFTECLAVACIESPAFARAFLIRLCGSEIAGISVEHATVEVATQVEFDGGHSRPDMVFTLNGSIKIGVENKLWADEGKGQLAKYLQLEVFDALVYIVAEEKENRKIDASVCANTRYCKPKHRDYFVWPEVFDLVREHANMSGAHPILSAVLKLFVTLGFEPLPASVSGELLATISDKVQLQAHYTAIWKPTVEYLRGLGWTKLVLHTHPNSSQYYVQQGNSALIDWALIECIVYTDTKTGTMRLSLVPKEGVALELLFAEVQQALLELHPNAQVMVVSKPRRMVKVLLSIGELLREDTQTLQPDLATAFAGFFIPIFMALHKLEP